MITTLLSLLGGGFMRLLPELIGLWNKKTDNAHELAMLDKQFQLEQTRASAKQAEIAQQGDIDQTLALLAAQKEALTGQMQPMGGSFQLTGVKFVDGLNGLVRTFVDVLNMLVRPATTYYFLIMFGLYKAALLSVALTQHDIWTAILLCYDESDKDTLAGILAFWFVGRVFDKKQQ